MKCHLNGVSLAGRSWPVMECWLGSLVISKGSGPVLQNPYNVIFQGVGGPDPCVIMCTFKFTLHNSHM